MLVKEKCFHQLSPFRLLQSTDRPWRLISMSTLMVVMTIMRLVYFDCLIPLHLFRLSV